VNVSKVCGPYVVNVFLLDTYIEVIIYSKVSSEEWTSKRCIVQCDWNMGSKFRHHFRVVKLTQLGVSK
jgi:hypothetical protein